MILYHVTTQRKAKRYKDSGHIKKPVRGFTTLLGAMAWAIKTGRKIIYEIHCERPFKLPDHHNDFGEAWWNDGDVVQYKCVFSGDQN